MRKYTMTEAVRNEIVEPHDHTRECEDCGVMMTCEEVEGVREPDDIPEFLCKDCCYNVVKKKPMVFTEKAAQYFSEREEDMYQCEKCHIGMLNAERSGGSMDKDGHYDDIVTCEDCRHDLELDKVYPCC